MRTVPDLNCKHVYTIVLPKRLLEKQAMNRLKSFWEALNTPMPQSGSGTDPGNFTPRAMQVLALARRGPSGSITILSALNMCFSA